MESVLGEAAGGGRGGQGQGPQGRPGAHQADRQCGRVHGRTREAN